MALSGAGVPFSPPPLPRRGPVPAVFIDKDGTLVYDLPYNVDPARLRRANYRLVLITNQPGLAHGLFDEHALDLARSWFIDDIEAGRRAGCRCPLLDVGSETE